jgi:hypothetical protein
VELRGLLFVAGNAVVQLLRKPRGGQNTSQSVERHKDVSRFFVMNLRQQTLNYS